MSKAKREALADVQHAIWAHWMQYQFSVCIKNPDGSLTIPTEKVERWTRQMKTDYKDLSFKEQESDRHQADKVLEVLKPSKKLSFPEAMRLMEEAFDVLLAACQEAEDAEEPLVIVQVAMWPDGFHVGALPLALDVPVAGFAKRLEDAATEVLHELAGSEEAPF